MITKDLIKRLQKCNPDHPVRVTMFEDHMAMGTSDSVVVMEDEIYTTGGPFVHIMAERTPFPPYKEREEITIEDWVDEEDD